MAKLSTLFLREWERLVARPGSGSVISSHYWHLYNVMCCCLCAFGSPIGEFLIVCGYRSANESEASL